ncbi:GYD domain-containing protein [Petropleomorpha daqingensis]|uniref:Uncharacterized protein with GYD domain n=1 Tax=Petropleomorpha daqingensis TaxID=2026353 RepID=A0A853CK37_9ACTN|nr:GYD domain-containing protein [Petropleomorpha daqingensis]NYJ06628.1 uncharacterized protein with GYD domain [Petropleomorpha daqingensis]
MARYLFIANYGPQGSRALMQAGGSARVTGIEKTLSGLGGRLESFDFAFGGDDAFVIVDVPDAETAAAVALTVNASGTVSVRTVALLTPEQVDRAAQIRPDYSPPGQS